jgi:hypothetical protein
MAEMHVLQEQKQAQLRAFWAVRLRASCPSPFGPACGCSILFPTKLSMAGPLSHLTARDGGNVGLAGALTDPADRPDISAVSAAAPEAQKTVTALLLFRAGS